MVYMLILGGVGLITVVVALVAEHRYAREAARTSGQAVEALAEQYQATSGRLKQLKEAKAFTFEDEGSAIKAASQKRGRSRKRRKPRPRRSNR